MPLILPANTLLPSGYDVANSCRFDGSSAVMEKTFSSAGNRDTFTLSCWVKRSSLGSHQRFIGWKNNGGGYGLIWEGSDRYDALRCYVTATGSNAGFLTNRLFRDVSAWYHIVLKIDTTQSTEADRMRLYINGVEETSFASRTYPNQNEDTHMNLDNKCRIGCNPVADNSYLGGYLAEVCFIDGSALAPTEFGEFDEDSPTIWKPKDVSGLTFGSNGFYLDFEDSGDLGDDESGNGNDFTEANLAATDQHTDSPTNNFATLNPLAGSKSNASVAEGNLQFQATTAWCWLPSTICPSNGKWYYEYVAIGSDPTYEVVGVVPFVSWDAIHGETIGAGSSSEAESIGYSKSGNVIQQDSAIYTGTSYGAGDIICVAVDLDNRKIYFRKNGAAWENSGDPTSGATGTGAADLSATLSDWSLSASEANTNATSNMNYGGGCTFTISSGNADGNGYGNFEYAPPSGYYALCTKNLGSDGG